MRPEILFPLFSDATALDGVGPKTAPLFEKLGVRRPVDALFLAPTGVVDRRLRESVQGAPVGTPVTVRVTIGEHRPPRRRGAPYRIAARDSALDFTLVFFRPHPEYLLKILPTGAERIVSGRIELYDGMAQMPHPDLVLEPDDPAALALGFEPVYPLTAGLAQKGVARAARSAVALAPELPEWLDAALMRRHGWPGWRAAVEALHAPASAEGAAPDAPARERLAYDEVLSHQLALALARARRLRKKGRASIGDGRMTEAARAALPFALTGAQERAFAQIVADLGSETRMLRLLQGDVGAGKTVVALLAMLTVAEAGGQAALMAPTDILARQHFAGLHRLAEAAGARVALLTGRDRPADRARTEALLENGDLDIVMGTHALFQGAVRFRDLRLAVIDEQHRFGVEQREALAGKGAGVDILGMSATPIPRTLALASFGDMEISILDEKPPGRQPIDTRMVSLSRYAEVVDGLRRAVEAGARAYWICPLVAESDAVDLAAAEDRARALRQALGEGAVGLVHGRMKGPEKDAAMRAFQSGETRVLVATTVVEVGVDVPEATIMVIEHAERFGLAQLHQLRGRVGRGAAASSCVLLYQGPLGETARARLAVLRETEDGFRIAEEDLKLRGAGDLLGVRQAGLPDMKIADLAVHADLMAIARDDARLVVAQDAELQSERGHALRILLYLMGRDEAVRRLASA